MMGRSIVYCSSGNMDGLSARVARGGGSGPVQTTKPNHGPQPARASRGHVGRYLLHRTGSATMRELLSYSFALPPTIFIVGYLAGALIGSARPGIGTIVVLSSGIHL